MLCSGMCRAFGKISIRQAAVGNFEEDENKQKFGCCVRTNNRNRDRSAGCIIMFLGVLLTAWVGIGVVASAHKLIGETSPLQAEPGTIREDLAVQTGRNVVHGRRQAAVGNFEEDDNKKKFRCCVCTNNKNRDRSVGCKGVGVVASAHKLIGETSPLQVEPDTIREDLAVQTGRNVVHGSDSPEIASVK
ncbi:nucleoside diphosphate kinase 2, chloroplastic [Tanacetum coccineum]